jgi:tetratricopeptide (TPR) repeat protein
MRYRAFISYSHADAVAASWLHRKLEGWRVPRRMRVDNPALPDKLAPVFRDREELGSAGELGPQIQGALEDSEALIVLCSPDAARSPWVDKEVRAFRASGRGERVFALIVAGEPHSGDERECFPPSLRESEPLAADLRAGKDGKELALLKLIAGLLGVPLDALRQREARRRHQRMLAVTSLALVVMLVTSFLAVQASIARQAAERRQKQAEALVGFMLGDLNDKLSEVSRLDILEGVHDHAMAYFKSLPDTDLTPEAMEQRARAYVLIGNVRRDQGHLPKAMESYAAAEKITARLAQATPQRIDRQLAHADVLTYLGLVHWYQGELDQAQASFEQARAVLLRSRGSDPDNQRLLFQLATVDNNAGHVLEGRGSIDAATVHYRQMLETTQKLVRLAPENADWQTQLGLAYNNLAKMALLQGDLAGAVAGYRADLGIETRLAQRDRRNNAQAERVVWSSGALGRTLALTGAIDEGAVALQHALDEAERLRGLEADASTYLEDIGIYASQLARLRRLQGDPDAARALAARSLAAFDALAKLDSTNLSWQRDRADALVERARLAIAGDATAAARADLHEVLVLLEPQLAQQPDDRGMLLTITAARILLAELGDANGAQAQLAPALAACDAQKSAPRDPRLRALRAELLLRLGQQPAARELASELWGEGYRDAGFAEWLRAHAIVVDDKRALAKRETH